MRTFHVAYTMMIDGSQFDK